MISRRLSFETPNRALKKQFWGWSGGVMVLGKLPVPGRPMICIIVGQGPIALAVDAGGGCLDIFTLICPFCPLPPSLWETVRYRLKYRLKRPLNPKQPTNQLKKQFFNMSRVKRKCVFEHLRLTMGQISLRIRTV